jgi:hypothetical protein
LKAQIPERLPEQAASCICFSAPYNRLNLKQNLGMDNRYADVTLLTCPDCDQSWMRYHYENEAFSGSGRWYLGVITIAQDLLLTVENAKTILEGLDWYFYGGSYFNGQTSKSRGKIYL